MVNPNRRHTLGNGGLATAVGLVVGDALSFGDTVKRLFAAAIVVALGISLTHDWDPQGLVLAAILFLVIRPLAVWLATLGTRTPPLRRLMIGWLGIRGISSVNYIAYAFSHSLAGKDAERIVNMALTLIVASVIVHDITVTPLLNWRQARQTARQEDSGDR